MISHFMEEFHPNDEDDVTQAVEELFYACLQHLKDEDSTLPCGLK